jgi:methyl-accepting chemotaxis protein
MQLNAVTQKNAAAAEEMSSSAEELASQAEQLKETITFYKTENDLSYISKTRKKQENFVKMQTRDNVLHQQRHEEPKKILNPNILNEDGGDMHFESF